MKKTKEQLLRDIKKLNARIFLSSSFCETYQLRQEIKSKIKELKSYED